MQLAGFQQSAGKHGGKMMSEFCHHLIKMFAIKLMKSLWFYN